MSVRRHWPQVRRAARLSCGRLLACAAHAQSNAPEEPLKAVFVFNFAKYNDWPAGVGLQFDINQQALQQGSLKASSQPLKLARKLGAKPR